MTLGVKLPSHAFLPRGAEDTGKAQMPSKQGMQWSGMREWRLVKECPEKLQEVRSFFDDALAPLLQQIEQNACRCDVLYKQGEVRGVVAYDTPPEGQEVVAEEGALRIKALLLPSSSGEASEYIERGLIEHVERVAKNAHLPAVQVHLNVGQEAALVHLRSLGFQVVREVYNVEEEGTERLLQKCCEKDLPPSESAPLPPHPLVQSLLQACDPVTYQDRHVEEARLQQVGKLGAEDELFESVPYCGAWRYIKPGDGVRFVDCRKREVFCRVTKVIHFNSFGQMLGLEDFSKHMPGAASKEAAILAFARKYRSFRGQGEEWTVLSLHLRRVFPQHGKDLKQILDEGAPPPEIPCFRKRPRESE